MKKLFLPLVLTCAATAFAGSVRSLENPAPQAPGAGNANAVTLPAEATIPAVPNTPAAAPVAAIVSAAPSARLAATVTAAAIATPEPATYAIAGVALVVLGTIRRRKS